MALIKCSECETEMSDKAKFCPKCGTENKIMFCPECGKQLSKKAIMCPKCGYAFENAYNQSSDDAKSKVSAALLAFFLGAFGIHNFYLGYTGRGVTQLLLATVGWIIIIGPLVSVIWAFVEFILILTGSINKDAHGNSIV